MTTIFSFLFAITVLVAVHEYGHYKVAVLCGVKVLRFSIGFGPVLWRWTKAGSDTEFVLSAVPFGGYVRMLDERESPVEPEQRRFAFNNQSLSRRSAIVAAGPLANLLLAVLLYSGVYWVGIPEPAAVIARPAAHSMAAHAGLKGKERIEAVQWGDASVEIRSLEELRWQVMQAAMESSDIRLQGRTSDGQRVSVVLPLHELVGSQASSAESLALIGLNGAWTAPRIVEVQPGGAAQRDGIESGDLVVQIDGEDISDGAHLRQVIREAAATGRSHEMTWRVRRANSLVDVKVTPDVKYDGTQTVGRIGALVGDRPELLTLNRNLPESLFKGLEQTWSIASLTLKMMGKVAIGDASIKNISGPITIADYAGKSASLGAVPFVMYLALISVSLGVLNLLPLPMLDGGHLMYYLWEKVAGRPVSEQWLDRLQKLGVGLLLTLMTLALYNDISRFFG